MVIPYTYDPITQDLWLYQDHVISWTLPTPGSATIKRPFAWNPSSRLYGYRNSIIGISARPRTLDLPNLVDPSYTSFNPPSDPKNIPVWFNSWPMTMHMVASGYMMTCKHCYGMWGTQPYELPRNTANTVIGPSNYPDGYQIAAKLDQAFRFIDGSNNVTPLDPRQIIAYTTDPPSSLNLSASVSIDLGLLESLVPTSVPRITPVDPRTLPLGATGWCLDSNHKIIRVRSTNQYVQGRRLTSEWQAVKPDGTELPAGLPVQGWSGDSGSFVLVEIKPPTSPAAGDGILGVCLGSNFSPQGWVVDGFPVQLSFDIDGDGNIADANPLPNPYLVEYLASRGAPMIPLTQARRTGAHATETVEQQILGIVT